MLYAVITTIAEPTVSVRRLVKQLEGIGGWLVVAGDRKGPRQYQVGCRDFLSIDQQRNLPFQTAALLPEGHYTRKNLGYLHAIGNGAECIYETDDDNAPLDSWQARRLVVPAMAVSGGGWVNVYRFFSREFIWPRGLPLDQIRNGAQSAAGKRREGPAPIQQGLADNSPDVDAVWRLLYDRPVVFGREPSIQLGPGTWCPFNSQSTWWWPEAYPLMYLPSFCSFRMTDIWRSFVAQRCLWEMGYGLVFHAAEVYQERNLHDLMKDFEAEIPGYRGNQAFVDVLKGTSLKFGSSHALDNLVRCYEGLIEADFFPDKEMSLVRTWAEDIERLML